MTYEWIRRTMRLGMWVLVVLLATACTQDGASQDAAALDDAEPPTARTSADAAAPADSVYRQAVEQAVNDGAAGLQREALTSALATFYEGRGYDPAWVAPSGPTDRADAVLSVLRDPETPGPYGVDLDVSALERRLDDAGDDPAALARLDVLLTGALLQQMRRVEKGLVQPDDIDPQWYRGEQTTDYAGTLETIARRGAAADAVGGLAPQHAGYARLKDALGRYQRIADQGGWPAVPSGDVVEAGETSPRVPALRERLRATGDLGDRVAQEDSLYDAELADAVRAFQRRHGLTVDGLLGPSTVEALNVPVEDRIEQIALNLERWRWLPDDLGGRYVVVNIPEFRLRAFDGGQKAMEMGVVVGKEFNGRATPVFSDEMEYVIFRPYWFVPQSIVDEEILPEARRDRSYLPDNHYQVVSHYAPDAQVYDAYDVDLDRLASGDLRLRQTPGDHNALGLVKFMFPNDYAIYLHDTPADHLFDEADRAYSHGCIRVERPTDFATFVFAQMPAWDRDRIARNIQQGDRQQVNLDEHIPVYIFYWTAYVDEEDGVQFRDDLYGHDDTLADALRDARNDAALPAG